MEDVQKLVKYIEETLDNSDKNLMEGFGFVNYINLSKCLLLKLWMFNRRRVGEVDDMLLSNWLSQMKSTSQVTSLKP